MSLRIKILWDIFFFIVVIILLIFSVKQAFCVKRHLTFQVKRVFFVLRIDWNSFLCQLHIAISVIKTFCARPLWWWISILVLLTRAKKCFFSISAEAGMFYISHLPPKFLVQGKRRAFLTRWIIKNLGTCPTLSVAIDKKLEHYMQMEVECLVCLRNYYLRWWLIYRSNWNLL